MFEVRLGYSLLALVGQALPCACSGSSEDGAALDGRASGAPTAPGPAAATIPSPASVAGAPPMDSAGAAPVAPGAAAFEPQLPEVLLDGLDYPARFAIAGDHLYVGNRRSSRLDGSLDQMLRLPLSLATGPEVLFEHAAIDDFAVTDTAIWVTALEAETATAFDRQSGEQLEQVRVDYMFASNVTVAGDQLLIAFRPVEDYGEPSTQLDKRPLGGGESTTLWSAIEQEFPQRFRVDASGVYVQTAGQDENLPSARLFWLPLTGGPERELYVTRFLGAFDVVGEQLVFSDRGEDLVAVMPTQGGEARVLAALPDVYGLAVDGDYAYLASQTDYHCFDGPQGGLFRLRISDGELVSLADPLPCPSMVAVTPTHLYWINNGGTVPSGPPIAAVDAEPSAPAALQAGMSLGNGSLMRMSR